MTGDGDGGVGMTGDGDGGVGTTGDGDRAESSASGAAGGSTSPASSSADGGVPSLRGVFGPGTLVLGAAAVLLVSFLALGFVLPGRWEAGVEARLPVPASALRRYLDSPEGWQAWTTWPDSALVRTGPDRGAGSAISWDDPELGAGTLTIEEARADGVTYAVEVEGAGGSVMRTRGVVDLTPTDDSTVVRWRERGDLGANPLMGYWALFMGRAQSAEMQKSLDRLGEVAGGVRSEPGPTR